MTAHEIDLFAREWEASLTPPTHARDAAAQFADAALLIARSAGGPESGDVRQLARWYQVIPEDAVDVCVRVLARVAFRYAARVEDGMHLWQVVLDQPRGPVTVNASGRTRAQAWTAARRMIRARADDAPVLSIRRLS